MLVVGQQSGWLALKACACLHEFQPVAGECSENQEEERPVVWARPCDRHWGLFVKQEWILCLLHELTST